MANINNTQSFLRHTIQHKYVYDATISRHSLLVAQTRMVTSIKAS